MVKPNPVEAKASAASGVTSSNACCQAADACGTTTMSCQCQIVPRLKPTVEGLRRLLPLRHSAFLMPA